MDADLPLSWPSRWKNPSALDRLLLGMPFIGPQAKAYKHVCAQLQERQPNCLSLWGNDPKRVRIANELSKILESTFQWPSNLFIPVDPFEILCWDHTAYSVDDMRILEVSAAFNERLGTNLPENVLQDFLPKTYGEVVDAVMQLQKPA